MEYVGPRVGAELRRDGLYAMGIASLLILAYIAFRFSAPLRARRHHRWCTTSASRRASS